VVAVAAVAVVRSQGRSGLSAAAVATGHTAPRTHARSALPVSGAPLRTGDRGARVIGLQAALGALGLYDGDPDGGFGPATRAAVVRFQSAHGIAADGVVGAETSTGIDRAVVAAAERSRGVIRSGIAAAQAAGRLTAPQARAAAVTLAAAVDHLRVMQIGPAAVVGSVLRDVADQGSALDPPRARALFRMLAANVHELQSRRTRVPAALSDIRGSDGVVYRYFPGHGYQFHPLASFAALAAAVTAGQAGAARRIADAMVGRAVPIGRTLVWEYYFPFAGPDRWTSGFAQAAGADALARAGKMLGDARISSAARRAFAAIPAAYLHPIAGGSWILEYSSSPMLILNAQLQAFLLLSDYAHVTGDSGARVVAGRMETAARALLPQFDTGCWSRYSLGGAPASTHYHAYHIGLLRRIAALSGDRSWGVVAARWQRYQRHGGCPPA
jgi:peptidoglycan hydrolase-like protein with peptidoglycan-binding domain